MVDRDHFMNLLLFLSLSGSAIAGLFFEKMCEKWRQR